MLKLSGGRVDIDGVKRAGGRLGDHVPLPGVTLGARVGVELAERLTTWMDAALGSRCG